MSDNKTADSWALDPRRATAIWTILIAAAVTRCWLVWLKSGFWLDETGTYYMISGNWHQLLQRISVTSQSPLYLGLLFADEEIPIPSGRGALVIRFRHRVTN